MKKVLMVQTVFCPTRHMLQMQLDSFASLNAYWRKYPYKADLFLSGYVHENYLDEFVQAIRDVAPGLRCAFLRSRQNMGKSHVVNAAVTFALGRSSDYQYLFTFDSDICFLPDEPDLLPRLIRLSEHIGAETEQPSGLIACNLTAEGFHWLDRFQNRQRIGDEIVSWPSQAAAPGGGIAGSCIFVSMEAWRRIGGYRVIGPYAPDDGYLMIDMESTGYHICVAETVRVHHPPRSISDPAYETWKVKAMQRFSERLHSGLPLDLKQDHEKAEQFWAERRRMEES
jgi:hypothetical protein